jgi:hypothetical protein
MTEASLTEQELLSLRGMAPFALAWDYSQDPDDPHPLDLLHREEHQGIYFVTNWSQVSMRNLARLARGAPLLRYDLCQGMVLHMDEPFPGPDEAARRRAGAFLRTFFTAHPGLVDELDRLHPEADECNNSTDYRVIVLAGKMMLAWSRMDEDAAWTGYRVIRRLCLAQCEERVREQEQDE